MFDKLVRLFTFVCVSGVSLLLTCPLANSVDFPKKAIKIVACAGVGGGEDTEARGIAPYAQKHLGVNVLIENQTGAGGKIAFEKFQRTEPDGYTLITYTFPKSIVIEYLDKTNYRTKDYTPVFAWSRGSLFLVVNSETWKTFDEFLKAAKARTLSGGISGRGSSSHLAGLLLVDGLGLKVNWVPYEGAAEGTAALAGKHLDFTIALPASVFSMIRAGKLRPLLMLSDRRDPFFPDVPTPKDLGYSIPSIPTIRGVEAPPNTPSSIVKVLEEAFSKAAKEPGFIEWTKKTAVVLDPLSSQEFGKVVVETYPKIEKFKDKLKE